MSKWRQKGVVQDSDEEEEEESQIESQGSRRIATVPGRVERVDEVTTFLEEPQETGSNASRPTEVGNGKGNGVPKSVQAAKEEEPQSPPARRLSPRRPTASPLTPVATYRLRTEPTESPDPLQSSPTPKLQKNNPDVSSQLLGSPTFRTDVLHPDPRQQDNTATLLQTHLSTLNDGQKAHAASNILGAFGIELLSDDSDDDPLSDPPTDLESPESGYTIPHPHRRTAVQVVIPSSTALHNQIWEHESRREFRQRKPIQLHPYALEGELYRREVQSRGLKPVSRPKSPERRTAQQDAETQEKEFDPNETPESSPPELEIPVSTPITRGLRKDGLQRSSARPSVSNPARRRLPATQLHLPHTAKRRKLNLPLTQVATASTSIFEDEVPLRDVWSIPPNSPPYSSSPLLNGHQPRGRLDSLPSMLPAPNLPTPSTSSILQDDPQPLLDSDLDPVPRSAPRSGDGLRRPIRIVLSDQSLSDSEPSSEEEQSDKELRTVGRKIKGVLPASWLRFDRQAQERRKAQARERDMVRHDATLSPQPFEPQRGVAQKVLKRNGGVRSSTLNTPARKMIVISDESDDEHGDHTYNHTRDLQTSAEDATVLAAALDRRYAADDSDDMENDRLHLFTLGGRAATRKKQLKLADAFGRAKNQKVPHATKNKSYTGPSGKGQYVRSRKIRRSPPPALSVVDLDLSPSKQSGSIPQFLRLARRQALRRPDLARQSPQTKQIRLHNARDTEDANSTLQRWRQGALKPKANATLKHRTQRLPLGNKADNQQYAQRQTQGGDASHKDYDTSSDPRTEVPRGLRPTNRPPALEMFERASVQTTKSSQRSKNIPKSNTVFERTARRPPVTFRTGQLEDDEKVFGRGHRKIAFEKGLRHADHQAHVLAPQSLSYMNPQLARFLADDDAATLPPLPSARDIGEEQPKNMAKQFTPPKRRLVRKKMLAQRVDIDAREYRQPSEPAVQEILNHVNNKDEEKPPEDDQPTLQGLGPYGTRYPTTFDVTYLQSETYFHSSTLIGSEDLRRALSIGQLNGRDLDEPAGYCMITHDVTNIRSGPWNDETSSALYNMARNITVSLGDEHMESEADAIAIKQESLATLIRFLRSLTNYVSVHLSFSDSVDRRAFVIKMHQLLFTLFDQVSVVHTTNLHTGSAALIGRSCLRVMNYLLVLGVQTCKVAENTIVDPNMKIEVHGLVRSVAKVIITQIIQTGVSEVSNFLEQNKRHAARQNGVQEDEVVVESVVVCMHALENLGLHRSGFWDLVNEEVSSTANSATHVRIFESAWATLFTLVPFIEIDISGIPSRARRESFTNDNWSCINTMLRRLFELYPSTFRKHGSSLNDYVRANLARCHRLIKHWYWQRPEQMLNAVFDFFGKNGLRQLRREFISGSVSFFDHATAEQPLTLELNECAFHVALKCLVLGLLGMRKTYTEKKIRSFVFRTIPNHGRSYPKDQPLDEESLAALRNHHDLLCTLYWAAPPSCRPRLDLIRCLVSHETSHREACRVSVRAWANLTTFQLSTDEPYASAEPFALWHKDIMHQTLKQYRLARTEADDYLKSGVLDGTTDVSAVMVRHTMEQNQEQVIATLRDCIAGMRKAIRFATDQTPLNTFLVDSDIVHLLELPHLEDRRLVNVIRDTLLLLQEYVKLQRVTRTREESQQTSEESQDYGDFPDIEDLNDFEPQPPKMVPQLASFDFIETSLWHLLSNAFGAEVSPDDNLLMDCVDTWILVADIQVTSGTRSWSYYIDSFSQVSWQQLRHTEQTRKFGPYFLGSLIDSDPTAYEQHRHEFITALLLSLVDREALLRFQHRLLNAIAQTDNSHSLVKNLPFFRDQESGDWDITPDTVRLRRLALISSLLSNMRDDLHTTISENPSRTPELRRMYATMLKDFMTRMKNNYQQLQQGSTVTGAYVEFVQKIVQFLKQYTGEICPVLPFFTDSVAFPLPSTDPTYVVGRLCGYAPKAIDSGTAKQLSVFIQTVAQQAAADNQQSYLVNQLTIALCSDEAPAADRATLRSVLLQGIFPTYLEKAFSSNVAFLIARPILESLPLILSVMFLDLRITHPDNVSSIVRSIVAISHAFIRGADQLKEDPRFLEQSYVLSALTYMFDAMASIISLLEYICSRTMTATRYPRPPLITYMKELSVFVAETLHAVTPYSIPFYQGDAHAIASDGQNGSLLTFCKKGLEDSMKTNWSERDGAIWFGQGHAKREVIFDISSVEDEKAKLIAAIEIFQGVFQCVYMEEDDCNVDRGDLSCNVVV